MGRGVTIADVAEYIGVSKSTVSHALSGKRRISTEVCRQVERAVRELGYRPNFAARVMNTRRTGLVGLLVPNLQNHHTTMLIEALGRELGRHALQLVLSTTVEVDDGANVLRKFSNGMVDAVINTLPELSAEQAVELAAGVPTVTYLRHTEAPLEIDFAAGIRQAMAFLTELGHREIGIIASCDRAGSRTEDPCVAGYREALAESGAPLRIWTMSGGNIANGRNLAPEIFASGVTAVLAGNDMVASGIMQQAIASQVPIPEALSIVGHDDTPMAQMIYPTLTTLQLPIDTLAAHTARVLLHAINPALPLPEPCRVVPTLIRRLSTGKRTEISCLK